MGRDLLSYLAIICLVGLVCCGSPRYSLPPQTLVKKQIKEQSPPISQPTPIPPQNSHRPAEKPVAEKSPPSLTQLPAVETIDPLLIPGDSVRISVAREDGLSREFIVPPDGMMYYPLIEELQLSGKTLKQLARELRTKLSQYLVNPLVNVSIIHWAERKVYISMGSQGSQSVTIPATEKVFASRLLLAINIPSGIDRSNIEILRKDQQRKTRIHRFSLQNMLDNYDFRRDFQIQPGDLIVIKESPKVYIQGSVVNPGGFPVQQGKRQSIWELLALAGGPHLNADLENIKIYRQIDGNNRKLFTVSASTEPNSKIVHTQPNDIIIVPSKTQLFVNVYGEVGKPGLVPLTGDSDRLSSLIARAGGLTEFASAKITIYRRESDGKTKKYLVDYNAITTGDITHDIEMQPGDIIQVSPSIW